jgi:hypothetical protein
VQERLHVAPAWLLPRVLASPGDAHLFGARYYGQVAPEGRHRARVECGRVLRSDAIVVATLAVEMYTVDRWPVDCCTNVRRAASSAAAVSMSS